MSKIEITISMLRRMFSTKRGKYKNSLAGIRNRMKLMKQDDEKFNVEEFDEVDDLNEYEADFMNIGENHKKHEREMARNKEYLKKKIVIRKYFKEKEPRFLTFAEKELIRNLHETKPEDWPVEKLSESFPALPETIYQILRAKWLPKSVESVIQYDNVVVENWKNFRVGKLPVNPILEKHLMKFKDRKIILTDRETLVKQFIPSKPKFDEPKSKLFKNIIQTYLDQKQSDAKLLSQEDYSDKAPDVSNRLNKNQSFPTASTATDTSLISMNNLNKSVLNKDNRSRLESQTETSRKYDMITRETKKGSSRPLTFDKFVKAKLDDIYKESPEEGVALLNVYKKQISASEAAQVAKVAVASNDTAIVAEEDSALSKKDKRYYNIVANDNLVDTHIKVWHKKVDTKCDYVKPIKIAKHLYKPGMTYRIGDCYYDDDGEFLYRIPGVRS